MKPFYAKNIRLETPAPENLLAFHTALCGMLYDEEFIGERFARFLNKHLKEQQLKRRCIVQKQGEQPERVYFIAKGCAIYFFHVEKDGVVIKTAQYVLWPGDFILPPGTFAEWPSPISIELAADSTLLSMSLKHYSKALRKFPQGIALTNRWRDKLEKRRLADRADIAVRNTAFEQLLWLMQKWPDCFAMLSDQAIGDYLGGMARETVTKHKRRVIQAYHKQHQR